MLSDERKSYLNEGKHRVNEKHKYTDKMFKVHKYLFEYPELLRNTCIKNIEINDKDVIFTISFKNKDILITCDKKDANSLPMSCLNYAGYDETEEMNMALEIIKPKAVIFDIGANIGWYAINIILNSRGAKVHCFEPIAPSYNLLVKNLKLNKLSAHAYNIGLSDQNKNVKFFFDTEFAMASSMSNLRGSRKTVAVKCKVKKLDDFILSMPKVKKIDFIKCDVEGAELWVFKGALETIRKYKPVILSEILRKWSKKFGYHPNDILELLRSIGYECYVIRKNKIRKFGLVDETTMETNYLFFHKQKHAALVKKLL